MITTGIAHWWDQVKKRITGKGEDIPDNPSAWRPDMEYKHPSTTKHWWSGESGGST